MAMFGEFREFLLKTNAFALAIGIIIGGAIGKVVSSIVSDLLMPVVGMALPGGAWRDFQIPLATDAAGKVTSAINVGSFLGAVVDFIIIGFVVFMITRKVMKPEPPAPAAPMKTCPQCALLIPAAAHKCGHCTSAV
jgi:large conductance mechanosensitive channel